MSSSTWRGACACRCRRRNLELGERGFFLAEAVVLSFFVLACASAAFVYRALALGRAASAAETAAMYLAQEQIARLEAQPGAYLRLHTSVPWLGADEPPLARNGVLFSVSTSVAPHPETAGLVSAEVTVSWTADGRARERLYRKLVDARD